MPSVDLRDEIVVDDHTHPIADRPIQDRHFHPFQHDHTRLTPLELLQCFSLGGFVPDFLRSNGHDVTPRELERLATSANGTLLVAFALKELARYLGCDETPEAIADARRAAASDYPAYVRGLYAEARIDTILVDDGWPQPPVPVEAMRAAAAPTRVEVVFRIEPLIERLLATSERLEDLQDAFERAIRAAISDDGYVAYKSIVAYRTGLDIARPEPDDVRRAFDDHRRDAGAADLRPLRHDLFVRTMRAAAELGCSLHVHCGIGDNDIVMPRAMPRLLWPILTDPELRHTTVVLVHGGYPWLREAAFMANVLPNVHLDLSLVCPATGGALRENLLRVLEMAPFGKLLYGSDGLTIPEIAWVSAHLMRKALAETLSDLVDRGYLSAGRALDAGRAILWRNAAELYGLEPR